MPSEHAHKARSLRSKIAQKKSANATAIEILQRAKLSDDTGQAYGYGPIHHLMGETDLATANSQHAQQEAVRELLKRGHSTAQPGLSNASLQARVHEDPEIAELQHELARHEQDCHHHQMQETVQTKKKAALDPRPHHSERVKKQHTQQHKPKPSCASHVKRLEAEYMAELLAQAQGEDSHTPGVHH